MFKFVSLLRRKNVFLDIRRKRTVSRLAELQGQLKAMNHLHKKSLIAIKDAAVKEAKLNIITEKLNHLRTILTLRRNMEKIEKRIKPSHMSDIEWQRSSRRDKWRLYFQDQGVEVNFKSFHHCAKVNVSNDAEELSKIMSNSYSCLSDKIHRYLIWGEIDSTYFKDKNMSELCKCLEKVDVW